MNGLPMKNPLSPIVADLISYDLLNLVPDNQKLKILAKYSITFFANIILKK